MAESYLAEYQLTSEEAIQFASERRWETLTPAERGLFQLRQDCLCMDFSAFHEGITALLGRRVWTHEMARPEMLWEEYLGLREKPTMAEIIGKLPDHLQRSMIVVVPSDE